MLGEACHARMALAILANASEVTPSRIGEEDVGAKIDGLSKPLEAPTSARKASQIRRIIDCHKDIGIFRDRLVGYQRSYERDTQHPRTDACSSHKRADGEKKRPARFRQPKAWDYGIGCGASGLMLVRRGHPPMRVHILLRPGGKAPKSLAYGLAQHYGSVVERFRLTPDSRPYRKLLKFRSRTGRKLTCGGSGHLTP